MKSDRQAYNEIDAYIEEHSDDERTEFQAAEIAFDISLLLQRARENRSLSQAAAARLLGLTQQSVSRIEQSGSNVTLFTVAKYLDALGVGLEINARDLNTGAVIATVTLYSGVDEGHHESVEESDVSGRFSSVGTIPD